MSQTVRRIELPSGGWWEIETRPRWKHVRGWYSGHPHEAPQSGDAGRGDPDLAERALVSLTTAWSFAEKTSLDSLAQRDVADVLTAMELLRPEVSPPGDGQPPKLLAEELFAGLAVGRVPERFAEVHIMALTGWDWETLQETPADVVGLMALYMAVKDAIDNASSLDITEE
jgi:hypothetical protein